MCRRTCSSGEAAAWISLGTGTTLIQLTSLSPSLSFCRIYPFWLELCNWPRFLPGPQVTCVQVLFVTLSAGSFPMLHFQSEGCAVQILTHKLWQKEKEMLSEATLCFMQVQTRCVLPIAIITWPVGAGTLLFLTQDCSPPSLCLQAVLGLALGNFPRFLLHYLSLANAPECRMLSPPFSLWHLQDTSCLTAFVPRLAQKDLAVSAHAPVTKGTHPSWCSQHHVCAEFGVQRCPLPLGE